MGYFQPDVCNPFALAVTGLSEWDFPKKEIMRIKNQTMTHSKLSLK